MKNNQKLKSLIRS